MAPIHSRDPKPGFFLEFLRIIARPFFGKGYWSKPVLRSIAAWYRRAYRPEYVLVEGNKLYLNNNDMVLNSYLAVNGYWEKMETEMVKRYVKPGMKVLDIGANIGYDTLLMSSLVGDQGRVVAFEPDVTNFNLLSKSVAELPINNVELVQGAVWDTSGELQLYLNDENPGDHQVYNSGESREHYSVPALTIDEFARGESYDFLKMDIQGAEGHAFLGMRATLERHRPNAMILEFWPSALSNASTHPSDVYAYLVELGYSTFQMDEAHQKILPITFEQIMAGCNADWKYMTLLCTQKGFEPV